MLAQLPLKEDMDEYEMVFKVSEEEKNNHWGDVKAKVIVVLWIIVTGSVSLTYNLLPVSQASPAWGEAEKGIILYSSVADPWHFDTDQDPQIRTSD
jgi:hypothetical protein